MVVKVPQTIPLSPETCRQFAELSVINSARVGQAATALRVAAQAQLLELALGAQQAGESGFTYGLIYAHERVRANDARHAYETALRRASTRRTRRWTQ